MILKKKMPAQPLHNLHNLERLSAFLLGTKCPFDLRGSDSQLERLMNEHNHQKLLVLWFRKTYPQFTGVFFAIPNGGWRDRITAARMKDEGVLPGVPDLFLASPHGGKAGLWLEMKDCIRGRATQAQIAMHGELRAQGYAVEIAHGYDEAKAVITQYLEQ